MINILLNKKNHGFTITELMLAMGLTTIVGLGIFQVLLNNNSLSKQINAKIDERIEANLGDKLLLKDLRNAGPSLNNIYARDDNNSNFFDFAPDRSSAFYRQQTRKSRTLTLSKNGKKSFYFLAFDNLRGRGLFADAVTFFQVGQQPSDPFQSASLTYKGINFNNYLTAKDSSNNDINNSLLIEPENLNKLILVDSSSYMPTDPARPAVFIGKVVQSGNIYDIAKVPASSIPKNNGTAIWNYIIRTPTNQNVDPANFERFMYNLPPVGANGASVRIKPVRLFKYELDCTTTPSECVLYREDILHGESTVKFPVLRGFAKITFSRIDIATSVFNVTPEKASEQEQD